jgi:hypothetical protein
MPTNELTSSPSKLQSENDFLQVEDYDATIDEEFIREQLTPYLQDLYKDLLMRSN